MHTVDAPTAKVSGLGTQGLAWVTLVLAVMGVVFPAHFVRGGAPEGVDRWALFILLCLPTVFLLAGAVALWVLPPRRARLDERA